MRETLFALSLMVTGCSQAVWYGSDNMPFAQARAVMASESTAATLAGHLDGRFAPILGRETASASNQGYSLTYSGLNSSGQLCFHTDARGQYESSERGGEKRDLEHTLSFFRTEVLILEGRTTLDDLNEQSQWPAEGGKTSLGDVTARVTNRARSDKISGKPNNPGFKLTYDVELCGAAPTLEGSTRFITVTRMPFRTGISPSLFVWVVESDKGDKGDEANPQKPTAQQPGVVEPVPAASATVTGTDTLLAVLTSQKKYTNFLELMAEAGMSHYLTDPGPFTVFAPSNEAVAKYSASDLVQLRANTDRLSRVLAYHVVQGSHPSGSWGKQTKVTTVNGLGLTLRRRKNGSIEIAGARADGAELPASNGVIAPIDQLLAN